MFLELGRGRYEISNEAGLALLKYGKAGECGVVTEDDFSSG
jgi:hypothetical protein